MKKIFYSILIAGLALASASCQKVEEKTVNPDKTDGQSTSPALTITGSIVDIDGTKVSYGFTSTDKDKNPLPEKDKAKSCIKQEWEMGDQIVGRSARYNDNKKEFEFAEDFSAKVSSISSDGKAVFKINEENVVFQEGDILYVTYFPGFPTSGYFGKNNIFDISKDISNITPITPTDESGEKHINGKLDGNAPVIMCAAGKIEDNAVHFSFENQTAIVGIYKMHIADENEGAYKKITTVTLNGVGTKFSYKFQSTPPQCYVSSENQNSSISITDLNLTPDSKGDIEVTDNNLVPYFSVIPGASNVSISATDEDGKVYPNITEIKATDLVKGTYYYIGKNLGPAVAKIDDTYYGSVEEAVKKATSGCKIVLLRDYTMKASAQVGCEVEFDLNGHILTQDGAEKYRLGVKTGGKLTLVNSTEQEGQLTINYDTNVLVMTDGGTIEVKENVKILPKSNGTYVVTYINPAKNKSATFTLNGGRIDAGNSASAVCVAGSGTSTVTINSGKITGNGTNGAFRIETDNATVTITGGEISSSSYALNISKGECEIEGNNTVIKSTNSSAINVTGGALTVSGGEITSSASSSATIAVSGGSATVKGGKVSAATDCAITVSGSGTLAVTAGELESEGTATGKGISAINLGDGTGTVEISGGYIHAKRAAINIGSKSKHKVTLSKDCKLTSENTNTIYSSSTATATGSETEPVSTVTVTGGKYKAGTSTTVVFSVANVQTTKTVFQVSSCIFFGKDIEQESGRLAPSCYQVDNEDSETKDDYPKQIKYFNIFIVDNENLTVESALTSTDDATADCIIKLNADCTLSQRKAISNKKISVILDLNGHQLTFGRSGDTQGRINVNQGASTHFIVEDSQGGGQIIQSSGNAFYVYSGKLTVKSGKIIANAGAAIYMEGSGIVVVNGGTITSSSNAIYAKDNSSLTINDGFFKTTSTSAGVISRSGTTVTFNIYGGYYSKAVNSNYFAGTNYECVSNSDYEEDGYTYKVQPKSN